jgi:hypothetical protein
LAIVSSWEFALPDIGLPDIGLPDIGLPDIGMSPVRIEGDKKDVCFIVTPSWN